MNFYPFPVVQGLETELTLANFSPVGRIKHQTKKMHVFIARANNNLWEVYRHTTIDCGQTCAVKSVDLPFQCASGEPTPLLFMYPELLPNHLTELPSGSFQDTSPAWRSNIKLRSATTATSYQGEYPCPMLDLKRGTLVSIYPTLRQGPGIQTKIIAMNFMRSPVFEQKTVHLASIQSKQTIQTAKIYTNSCSVIDVQESSLQGDCYFYCRESVAIPVYLSHTANFSHLAMEHSHPPVEMLVFGNRNRTAADMKRFWIEPEGKLNAQ